MYPYPTFEPYEDSSKTTGTIIAAVVIIFFTILAIGLGVGLPVGLNPTAYKQNSTTNVSSAWNFSSAANCVYSNTTCGCAATKPSFQSTKIINGYPAVPNSWPWMVSLYVDGQFTCGGFIASTYQFVITAAHCLTDTQQNSVLIYAGLHTRSTRASAQVRSVTSWNIHPNYSGSPLYKNDIAIIKVNASYVANQNVSLCCLPSGTTQLPILNEFGPVVGWGTTISGVSSSLSDTLLQTVVQIQGPSTICNSTATSDIQFCAGYGTSDSCQGDSGGPLMTIVDNTWSCTGIVSYGNEGCGHSGFYTRVSAFRSYINQQVLSL